MLVIYQQFFIWCHSIPQCLNQTCGLDLHLCTGNLWQVRCCRWQVRCETKSPAVWPMLHHIPMDDGYGYGLGHGQVHDSEQTLSYLIMCYLITSSQYGDSYLIYSIFYRVTCNCLYLIIYELIHQKKKKSEITRAWGMRGRF